MKQRALLICALAMLLAACGAPAAAPGTTSLSPETTSPSPAAESSPSPAATSETTATAEATGDTRTITDALGNTVTIPAEPRRVLALGEEGLLADLIDAGVKPVAATVNVAENVSGFAAGELDGIQLFASAADTSLETFVALQPDLIVGSDYFVEQIGADTLNQLAPTVAVGGDTPREAYIQTMAIFGREDEARQQVSRFEQQVEQAGAQLDAAGRTVSMATIYPGPNPAAWIDGPYAPPRLAQELGFTLSPNADDLGGAEVRGGRAFISLEQLGLLDGETLVLLQSPAVDGEAAALEQIRNGPIWQTLPAVQNDRVVELDRFAYFGFRGEQQLLNDLIEALE